MLPGNTNNWKGPDLAFLRLPVGFVHELEALVNFINLEQQRALNQAPSPTAFTDVIAGVIEKLSDPPLAKAPTTITTLSIGALLNVGEIAKRTPLRGQDRLYFRPRPAADFVMPSSFKGTSGGGVWRIGVKAGATATKYELDRRLMGVAYYETKRRNVICHGPSSVYHNLLAILNARWPDDSPVI